MTHLLIVTTSYPDEHEGTAAAGSFVQDFAYALSSHVKVTVVAPGKKNHISQENQIQVQRFAVPRQPLSLLSPTNPIDWPDISTVLKRGSQAVCQASDPSEITHSLAMWALPGGYWAMQAQKRFGIPYSVWALGSDIWTLGKIPIVRGVLRRVLRNASNRYADGLALKRDVERIGGLPCNFLPSSRILATSSPSKTLRDGPPYRLAFLGRWHPNKGIDLLLQSLKLLTSEDWQRIEAIRIHGGGPLEPQVHNLAVPLIQAGRPITVGGYLDRDDARSLLDWTDYVMIPSRIESIPVIFSDAMQTRCPVVAMPVGDLPQIVVEYSCGILASKVSAAGFAQALHKTLTMRPVDFSAGLDATAKLFDTTVTAYILTDHLEYNFPENQGS